MIDIRSKRKKDSYVIDDISFDIVDANANEFEYRECLELLKIKNPLTQINWEYDNPELSARKVPEEIRQLSILFIDPESYNPTSFVKNYARYQAFINQYFGWGEMQSKNELNVLSLLSNSLKTISFLVQYLNSMLEDAVQDHDPIGQNAETDVLDDIT